MKTLSMAGPLFPKARWIHDRLGKAIMWTLWSGRNQNFFENASKEWHGIVVEIQELMFGWSKGCDLFRDTTLENFVADWEKMVREVS